MYSWARMWSIGYTVPHNASVRAYIVDSGDSRDSSGNRDSIETVETVTTVETVEIVRTDIIYYIIS